MNKENLVVGLLELTVCVSVYSELCECVLDIGRVRCHTFVVYVGKRMHKNVYGT